MKLYQVKMYYSYGYEVNRDMVFGSFCDALIYYSERMIELIEGFKTDTLAEDVVDANTIAIVIYEEGKPSMIERTLYLYFDYDNRTYTMEEIINVPH